MSEKFNCPNCGKSVELDFGVYKDGNTFDDIMLDYDPVCPHCKRMINIYLEYKIHGDNGSTECR